MATFVSLLFRKRWVTTGLIIWAALVSYSRIYLGVHYPGDVIGGALLGILLGWAVYFALQPLVAKKQGKKGDGIFRNRSNPVKEQS